MPALDRKLGVAAITAVVAGDMLGSGIFFTPGELAAVAELEWQVYFFWALCGFITLCGALTLAELSVLIPKAGVAFHSLKEGFGPFVGFLKAWIEVLVSGPGAVAGVAILFGEFASRVFSASQASQAAQSAQAVMPAPFGPIAYGTAAVVFFAVVNLAGVRWGGRAQITLTAVKILGLVAFIVGALVFAEPTTPSLATTETGASFQLGAFARMVGLGVAAVLFTYDGWVDGSHLTGEVAEPAKVLPRAMALGVTCITIVYLLVNIALLRVVSLEDMRAEPTTVAASVAEASFGIDGATLLNSFILISIFGALGGLVMSLPRMYYAAAADYEDQARHTVFRPMFSTLARLSKNTAVPSGAILYVSAAAILAMLFFGSFSRIVTFFVVPFQITNVLMVASIFRLRPRLSRPGVYHAPGYPWLPLIYIAVMSAFALSALVYNPIDCLIGLGLTALGVPVYWAMKMNRSSSSK